MPALKHNLSVSAAASLPARGMFRIKPGLDRVRRILRALGDPQDRVPALHIAGTNGKGSVAAGLESVLRYAGYRTGLYISPHFHDVRERIQLGGRPIGQEAFENIGQELMRAEEAARLRLTYFEFTTVMAFMAFQRSGAEIAVIETGLGGQWDATNVLEKPLASIITSIGLDHTQWLGKTEKEIALQKAGILKKGSPVISGVRGTGRAVMARIAARCGSSLLQIDQDFQAKGLRSYWSEGRQRLRYQRKGRGAQDVFFGLLGSHQVDNASLIMTTVDTLRQAGWKLPVRSVAQGLEHLSWPGRFQLIQNPCGPPLLFDGAHNPQAMRRFLQTLQESPWKNSPKTFIYSAYRDKEFTRMAEMIAPHAAAVLLCSLPAPRGAPIPRLVEPFQRCGVAVKVCRQPEKAFSQALEQSTRDGLVVVTGSLALVGRLLTQKCTGREKLCPLH